VLTLKARLAHRQRTASDERQRRSRRKKKPSALLWPVVKRRFDGRGASESPSPGTERIRCFIVTSHYPDDSFSFYYPFSVTIPQPNSSAFLMPLPRPPLSFASLSRSWLLIRKTMQRCSSWRRNAQAPSSLRDPAALPIAALAQRIMATCSPANEKSPHSLEFYSSYVQTSCFSGRCVDLLNCLPAFVSLFVELDKRKPIPRNPTGSSNYRREEACKNLYSGLEQHANHHSRRN
jgi:hypothetical protein